MGIFKPNPVGNVVRTTGSVGGKLGVLSGASIVGKNIGVAPAITETISDTVGHLPNILEVSSEIPGVTDIIGLVANNVDRLESLGADFQNFANVTAYTSALGLLYIIGRIIGSEKGRLEALGGSVVWTTIAASMFNEMYDTLQSNGRDLLGYLPMKFYDNLPEGIDSYLREPEHREAIYGAIAGIAGIMTGKVALGNIKTVFKGPKKDNEKTNK